MDPAQLPSPRCMRGGTSPIEVPIRGLGSEIRRSAFDVHTGDAGLYLDNLVFSAS